MYLDGGARQDPDAGRGCGVGLVIRIGEKWWGVAVPLETWVDYTTAELLGVVLGRYVVERLRDLGARSIEQTYDAHAVAALAEMPPEQQRHPLRRALQWSVGEAAAAHWWVKSHQEVPAPVTEGDVRKMGNILADAQATEAVATRARGHCMAVPLPLPATYGARPTAQGSADMEWCNTNPASGGRHGSSIPGWSSFFESPRRREYCWCRYTWGCGTRIWRYALTANGTKKLRRGTDARATEPNGGGPSKQWIRHGDCTGGCRCA